MSDLAAIGAAIATRLGSTTPPTGEGAIRYAAVGEQASVAVTPSVAVLITSGDFEDHTGNGSRQGAHEFTVRFYLDPVGDPPRREASLLAWASTLNDRFQGAVQLGGISTVVSVRVSGYEVGMLDALDGKRFFGIVYRIHVVTAEPWAAVA